MRKSLFIGAVFFFLVIALQSNAKMTISPNGVSSADKAAVIHLSGSFSTGDYTKKPDGAIISAVNENSGLYSTYGGYFTAAGALGRAVYGSASGSSGTGIYGSAGGIDGKGVYGYASGSDGFGVYGHASGSGLGVYGKSSVTGVQGYSSGNGGAGIYGVSGGSSGRGVLGIANGTGGIGVYGNGTQYDFYAAGGKTNFGPFTGAHEVKFIQSMQEEISTGMIVSVTGKAELRTDKGDEIALSSTMPTVRISSTAKDKAVFGVIVSEGPLQYDHWYKASEGERFGVVNALGEGRVWVTNRNGNIEAGDYITTSEIPGYGMLQNDDLLHSYTLGKAIETIDWERVTEIVEHDGKTYKRYLIAIVYTSG